MKWLPLSLLFLVGCGSSPAPLHVSSLTPDSVTLPSLVVTLVISGTGFTRTSVVAFGSQQLIPDAASYSELTVTLPPAVFANDVADPVPPVLVSVVNSDGKRSNFLLFHVFIHCNPCGT